MLAAFDGHGVTWCDMRLSAVGSDSKEYRNRASLTVPKSVPLDSPEIGTVPIASGAGNRDNPTETHGLAKINPWVCAGLFGPSSVGIEFATKREVKSTDRAPVVDDALTHMVPPSQILHPRRFCTPQNLHPYPVRMNREAIR